MHLALYPAFRPWAVLSAALFLAANAPAAVADTSNAPVAGAQDTAIRKPRVIVVDTPPPPPPEGVPLRLGLRRAEIRELLGRPSAVRPMESGDGKAEVWVYDRPVQTSVRAVSTGMRDEPWVDPITGEMRMLKVPILEYETESRHVELRLLMFHGRLINWAEVPTGTRRQVNS